MARGIGAVVIVAAALAACGGGGEATVGGTVTGLQAGTAVTLQINGRETLVIGADGPFQFNDPLNAEQGYDVRITGQPLRGFCTVNNGSGAVDRNATKVTNIDVQCVPAFLVGGRISGLPSGGTVTLDNGTETATFTSSGTAAFSFSFPTALPSGRTFEIKVTAVAPTGRTCSVTGGATGVVSSSDVTNIFVTCS